MLVEENGSLEAYVTCQSLMCTLRIFDIKMQSCCMPRQYYKSHRKHSKPELCADWLIVFSLSYTVATIYAWLITAKTK